ncbi:hypothetical protein [Streptomyces sp. TE5632]
MAEPCCWKAEGCPARDDGDPGEDRAPLPLFVVSFSRPTSQRTAVQMAQSLGHLHALEPNGQCIPANGVVLNAGKRDGGKLRCWGAPDEAGGTDLSTLVQELNVSVLQNVSVVQEVSVVRFNGNQAEDSMVVGDGRGAEGSDKSR